MLIMPIIKYGPAKRNHRDHK